MLLRVKADLKRISKLKYSLQIMQILFSKCLPISCLFSSIPNSRTCCLFVIMCSAVSVTIYIQTIYVIYNMNKNVNYNISRQRI